MRTKDLIPAFGLYGERDPFPDIIHFESFSARAPLNDWRILPHRHDRMSQLFIVDRGRIDATVDGVSRTLQDKTHLYVPDRCVHGFVFEPGTEGAVFSFPLSVVASLSPNTPQILGALSSPSSGTTTDRLRTLATLLERTALAATPFRLQQVLGLAHALLALLAETRAEADGAARPSRPSKLVALEELIVRHMAEGWTASDYAAALSMSTGHLSRLCRAATGRGAAAFIEQRAMEEACRLLAFTQLPVSEIGYRLGYIDPSYFSKRFRLAQGQTPSAYRSIFTR